MILQKFLGLPGLGIPGLKIITGVTKIPGVNPNIGKEDRMIRAGIGAAALVALAFVKQGFLIRYLLGLAALVGLFTAYTKFSPVYVLLGENTRKKKGKKK